MPPTSYASGSDEFAPILYQRLTTALRQNLTALRQPGSFAQNFLVSMSGSAIVTALGFLVTPILSRIYSPAAYGQFAVFNSVVNNLNVLATLAYTSAIPLPRAKRDALAVVQLNVVLTLGMFGVVIVALGLLGAHLVRWLDLQSLGAWIYLIPVLMLLYNFGLTMSSWYIRTKSFRTRSTADVTMSVVGRGFTLGYGWLSGGYSAGLILGDAFGKVTLFVGLLRSGFQQELGALWRTFSWRRIWRAAYKYREFPLYVLPAGYVRTLSIQLPVLLLSSSFGATIAGSYSFAAALLDIPLALIGAGIAPVFYQKAAEVQNTEPERLKDITLNIYNKLLYLGLLPLGFITIFGDWIFKYIFGPKWEMSGVFTGYLGYYYIFQLTSHATSMIYNVLGKQNHGLITSGALLGARALALSIGIYYHDANLAMLLFGLSSLLVTFLIDMQVMHFLRLPVFRIAMRTVGMMLITLGFLKGLRYGIEHFFPNL
ncbi:oligosaccharide flippase family protein [Hymenobacter ruricola]|uniref:Oligosaccharide flippase family protein n=1 Tax=Hymenobacter ruricola TaxID=2791023 RepID=A0ABS0I5H6_9BACT|nr:oligosaccharide flippase family protein [Hymenobacter ruricola]MBF9222154.1 oligosaccharide flippase family protein [Hymenobacter ruricola]